MLPSAFACAPSSAPALSLGESGPPPLIAQRDRNSITARWLAHDPNNDDLMFALDFRDVHEQTWHRLKDRISEHAYSFDAALLPDGEYELRVTASDAPVHTDADTLTAERVSSPFTVDTTPPVPGTLVGYGAQRPDTRHLRRDGRDQSHRTCGVFAGRRAVAVPGAVGRAQRFEERAL